MSTLPTFCGFPGRFLYPPPSHRPSRGAKCYPAVRAARSPASRAPRWLDCAAAPPRPAGAARAVPAGSVTQKWARTGLADGRRSGHARPHLDGGGHVISGARTPAPGRRSRDGRTRRRPWSEAQNVTNGFRHLDRRVFGDQHFRVAGESQCKFRLVINCLSCKKLVMKHKSKLHFEASLRRHETFLRQFGTIT